MDEEEVVWWGAEDCECARAKYERYSSSLTVATAPPRDDDDDDDDDDSEDDDDEDDDAADEEGCVRESAMSLDVRAQCEDTAIASVVSTMLRCTGVSAVAEETMGEGEGLASISVSVNTARLGGMYV